MVHPRDGKWSWFVCLSAALSWFAALGFVFSFGIFFPVFMDYFQESREKTGINRLLHRKCAVRIFIHESQNFRNSLVRYAHSFVSKVLQRVNKIRAKHFLWCTLFVRYI